MRLPIEGVYLLRLLTHWALQPPAHSSLSHIQSPVSVRRTKMSYYPPHTTGTTYPYTGYHPQTGAYTHPQTSGAYPTQYQPYAPTTAVTSYGTPWPYSYTYYQQQPQQQHAQVTPRPATTPAASTTTTTTATTTAAAASTSTTPAPITAATASSVATATRPAGTTYTFASYRDPNLYTRSSRKGSNYRGLFTKERAFPS